MFKMPKPRRSGGRKKKADADADDDWDEQQEEEEAVRVSARGWLVLLVCVHVAQPRCAGIQERRSRRGFGARKARAAKQRLRGKEPAPEDLVEDEEMVPAEVRPCSLWAMFIHSLA